MSEHPDDADPEAEIWEAQGWRFHLPESLAVACRLNTRLVRVPTSVETEIRLRHANVVHEFEHLNDIILNWQGIRIGDNRAEIYLPADPKGMRILVVIGVDNAGFLNLISMYVVRQRNWKNREISWREKR